MASRLQFTSIFLGAVLTAFLPLQAKLSWARYLRLGEDDPGDTSSAFMLSSRSIAYPLYYSTDVSEQASAVTGSSRCLCFPGKESGLPLYTGGGLPLSFFVLDSLHAGFEGWLKLEDVSSPELRSILSTKPGSASFGLFQSGDSLQAWDGVKCFDSVSLSRGQWVHAAIIRDGDKAEFYLNGALHGGTSGLANPLLYGVYLGANGESSSPAIYPSFRGALDEVRFFNFDAGQFSPEDLLLKLSRFNLKLQDGTPLADHSVARFASIQPGETTILSFTINNLGIGDLRDLALRLDGPDQSQFLLLESIPASIPAGSSATFRVALNPVTTGRKVAFIHLTSNDPYVPSVTVKLEGRTTGREISVQLPDGSPLLEDSVFPATSETLKNLEGVKMAASGYNQTLFLKRDGTVTTSAGTSTYEIPKGLSGVKCVAAGGNFGAALKNDGTAIAWSGPGSVQVLPDFDHIIDIKAGADHLVGLREDGTLRMWRNFNFNQGDVSDLTGIVSISARGDATYAVTAGGQVVVRGQDDYIPSLSGLTDVTTFCAGGFYGKLALLKNGKVNSQIGFGLPPSNLAGVTAIALPDGTALALKSDGSIAEWGTKSGFDGRTGVKALSVGVGPLYSVGDPECSFGSQIVGGSSSKVLTISSTGSEALHLSNVSITGSGAGNFSVDSSAMPGVLESGTSFPLTVTFRPGGTGTRRATLKISSDDPVRSDFTIMLTGTGDAPPTIGVFSGGELTGPLPRVAFAKVGSGEISRKVFEIRNTGTANLTGIRVLMEADQIQQGVGFSTFVMESTPPSTLAPGESAAFTVAFNARGRACLRGATLRVYSNDSARSNIGIVLVGEGTGPRLTVQAPEKATYLRSGKLGGYNDYPRYVPPLDDFAGAKAVAAGADFDAVIRQDGSVAVWSLPNNTAILNQPASMGPVSAIVAGFQHLLALKEDGSVIAWGDNSAGQCNVPAGLSQVASISAYGNASFAILKDGTVAGWGKRGDGSSVTVPDGLSGVVQVSASSQHVIALKGDGSVVCWGDNFSGQCNVPSGIGRAVSVLAIDYQTWVLQDDGTEVGFGYWGSQRNTDQTFVQYIQGYHWYPTIVQSSSRPTIGKFGQGWPLYDSNENFIQGMAVRKGAGATSGVVGILDDRVDFGFLHSGQTGSFKDFTISNTGLDPLTVEVELEGDRDDFALDTSVVPKSLRALYGAGSLKVAFAPKSPGLKKAVLHFRTNDKEQGDFQVILTGVAEGSISSYGQWLSRYFQDANGYNVQDRSSDPNGNGVPNLLEYVLGGYPADRTEGSSMLPRIGIDAGRRASLSYLRFPGRAGVTVTVQGTDDPGGSWDDLARSVDGGPYQVLMGGVTVTESGDGDSRQVLVTDQVSAVDPAQPCRFLRLQVQENP